jgi:glycosyltransferase involved in cell wall biosynthesis
MLLRLISAERSRTVSSSELLLSFVVIGLNEAAHLAESIESLFQQGFDRREIEILYVDSESDDGSPEVARRAGVDRVLTIPRAIANAARARNAGLAEVRAPFVQFVDGDTRIEPDWGRIGVEALIADTTLVGVEGSLREKDPNASIYNAVCELDWPSSPGEIDYVGGNGLYRVAPLREAEGFDARMRVGEEPELGVRLRARGWKMRHIHAPMARHDLELFSLKEYLYRAYTGGKACALVVGATGGARHGYWSKRMWRTLALAFALSAPLVLALMLLLWNPLGAFVLASFSLLVFLLLAARKSRMQNHIDSRSGVSLAYALHSYVSKIPAALGMLTIIRSGWVEPTRKS